jgi:predicted transposase YdaD
MVLEGPGSPSPGEPRPADAPFSYDKLLKAFLKRYWRDVAEWLLGERPESVEELETTHSLVTSRAEDKFLHLEFKDKPGVLLHLELQMKGDLTMPVRITEYFGYALKTLELAVKQGLRPACVVVYLDRELYREDPGQLDMVGELSFRLFASYKVVKLWDLSPEPVLAMESPGLCPFLPLMAGKPEELVIRSLAKIRAAPEHMASAEDKRELLQALASLAGRVIANMDKLTDLILSDQDLLESHPLYKKGQKAGKEEGAQEGQEALREAILELLRARFGEVPEDICDRLENIHTLADLKALVGSAARARDVDSFRQAIESLAG